MSFSMSINTQQQLEDSSLPKYRTLLEVAEMISVYRDLSELLHNLAPRLRSVIEFDFISVVLHDAERDVMRLHVLETPIPNSFPIGWELPVEQSPGGWVWQHQQPLHMPDISQDSRFPEVIRRMREHGINSCYMIPLTSAGKRLGALGTGSI